MTAAASAAAARSIFRSTAARNAARFVSDAKAARSHFRFSSNKTLPNRSFRYAAELSFCVESLLPYHTVTASALLTSMLSSSSHSYGWLPACNDDV